jgi:streptogramin lyase
VASRQSLWRINPATNRFVGSVPVGIEAQGSFAAGKAEGSVAAGYGAVWIMSFGDGVLLRVDPESQTVAKTIPLGTLIYPANLDAIAAGEGAVWIAVTSFAS